MPRKCFSCEYFCSNGREEKKHNFLLHYKQGSRLPVEDKPLNRTYLDEDLQKYWIKYSDHSRHYDFFDSIEIVPDFLTVFESNFLPRLDLRKLRFKSTFTLIKWQPLPKHGFVELTGLKMFNKGFILTSMWNQIWLRIYKENYQEWND